MRQYTHTHQSNFGRCIHGYTEDLVETGLGLGRCAETTGDARPQHFKHWIGQKLFLFTYHTPQKFNGKRMVQRKEAFLLHNTLNCGRVLMRACGSKARGPAACIVQVCDLYHLPEHVNHQQAHHNTCSTSKHTITHAPPASTPEHVNHQQAHQNM